MKSDRVLLCTLRRKWSRHSRDGGCGVDGWGPLGRLVLLPMGRWGIPSLAGVRPPSHGEMGNFALAGVRPLPVLTEPS